MLITASQLPHIHSIRLHKSVTAINILCARILPPTVPNHTYPHAIVILFDWRRYFSVRSPSSYPRANHIDEALINTATTSPQAVVSHTFIVCCDLSLFLSSRFVPSFATTTATPLSSSSSTSTTQRSWPIVEIAFVLNCLKPRDALKRDRAGVCFIFLCFVYRSLRSSRSITHRMMFTWAKLSFIPPPSLGHSACVRFWRVYSCHFNVFVVFLGIISFF